MSGGGTAGAFVALDPRDGRVLALGSAPTYDPSVRARPIPTQADYERLFGEAAGAPLFNRAISGGYPTGSIFKPITALAALDAFDLDEALMQLAEEPVRAADPKTNQN